MVKSAEIRRFDVGAKVMAKWPDSNLYFGGQIVDYNDVQYLVKFDDTDQSEYPLNFSDVLSPFIRSRSRSRGRTPTRKSPGRKSPSRKSPGRKTPTAKSPVQSTRGRKPKAAVEESSKEVERKEETNVNSVSTTLRSRITQVSTRKSARISSNPETTKIIDEKTNSIKVDREAVAQKIHDGRTWKGQLKRFSFALWKSLKPLPSLVFFLTFPLLLTQLCTKKTCELSVPDIPKKLKYYFDLQAIYLVLGFFCIQLLLALLPIGKVYKLKSGVNYRCNGFIALFVTMSVLPVLMYFKVDILGVYLLYRQIMATCTGLAVILGLALYAKSFYVSKDMINPDGKSGYFVPDVIEGREIMPRIGQLDLKMITFRVSILMMILLNVIIVMKNLHATQGNFSITLMVISALQIFFAFDFIWFEESMLTTYEHTRKGLGMNKMLEYLTLPFIMAFYPRFVLNHGKELPWYCLVGAAFLNLIGYVICRGANSQKHAFRSNPADPALAHLESLPTANGSRILVSGWWGIVRHPNYFGDLLIQLSLVAICGFHYALPWLLWGFSVVYLVARTFVVEADCKRKYGLVWSSYCSRVKYRLIPKVF